MSSQNEESALLAKIIEQNNIIINLVGRMAFTKDEVRQFIVADKQKTKQENYVKGYNACDGKHSVSEIAKIVGVTKGTLSPILQSWEEFGIIYPVTGTAVGKFYKKILPI